MRDGDNVSGGRSMTSPRHGEWIGGASLDMEVMNCRATKVGSLLGASWGNGVLCPKRPTPQTHQLRRSSCIHVNVYKSRKICIARRRGCLFSYITRISNYDPIPSRLQCRQPLLSSPFIPWDHFNHLLVNAEAQSPRNLDQFTN